MRAINVKPDKAGRVILGVLPFLLVLLAYTIGSGLRLAENPTDKILPAFATMGEAIKQYAFMADPRTGDVLLWSDTAATLSRLLAGLAIATLLALVFGVAIGMLPVFGSVFGPIVAVASLVPPLALLPILFIMLGLGEGSKIALVVIGTALKLIRDMAMRVSDLPREQLIKAQTLGASSSQIAFRIVIPQILPRLNDAERLEIGPAWLFIIAAEAIAADSGLGYRIFLVRRYLAMDVIIPYVVWITLLAFLMDLALRLIQRKAFPWFANGRSA